MTLNFLSPETWANPYPLYRQLREASPVYYAPEMQTWLLTRYRDVAAGLRDSRLSSATIPVNAPGIPEPIRAVLEGFSNSMVFTDPPKHTRLRTLVHKAFTPAVIARLAPTIEKLTHDLLDRYQPQGEMDFAKEFAYLLPITVILQLLQLPEEDRHLFKQWADAASSMFDMTATPETVQQNLALIDRVLAHFNGVLDERAKNPGDDLLSALLSVEEAGDRLSRAETIQMVSLLVTAGHETTTNLICNGLLAFFRNPEQLALLKQNPDLVAGAVEEIVRYDAPAQFFARVATESLDIDGCTINAGDRVALMFGAANHDPEKFDQPDDFDITRQDNAHLGFGGGIHYCLGAPLARLEGQIVFRILMERLPNMRLAGTELSYRPTMVVRALNTLPVAWN